MTAKLTPEACRAGRALLNWSVRDLMREAGVSPNTVTGLERGEAVRPATEAKIVRCFERFGVEITNGNGTGARMRSFWRVGFPKVGPGWTAHRYPFSGQIADIEDSREAVEAWLRELGQIQSETDGDVWFDPPG